MKKIFIVLMTCSLFFSSVISAEEKAEPADHFATMAYKWRENAVGNLEDKPELDDNEYVATYIEKLSEEAIVLYTSMNKTGSGSLWTRKSGETKAAYLTRNFKSLAIVTKAYGTQGSEYYQDPVVKDTIKNGIEYLVNTEKYDGNKYYGNWWDWQIGIPEQFLNILFIMKEDLSKTELTRYVNVIHKYVPNPYDQLRGWGNGEDFKNFEYVGKTSGANRTDLAHTILGIGILKEDADTIKLSLDSIVEVFDYVESGNGFYRDGMFIFHDDTPYIGSYGFSLIKAVSSMLSIVSETPYDMDPVIKEHFVKLVNGSTLPFIANGKVVPMVQGRAVSRSSNHTLDAKGSPVIKTLAIASQIARDSISQDTFKAVKYWVNDNPDYYLSICNNFEELIAIMNIIRAEDDLGDYVPFAGSKMFPSGDRYVYAKQDSYIGISMHSNRISAYTVGNGENLKGWHASDGVISLINGDTQFGKSYWATMDLYRLPGSTVDTKKLDDATVSWTSHFSKSNWAGGSYSDKNGAISMLLDKNGAQNNKVDMKMDLQANKSWFIIDGNVIALGSDIKGTSASSIETIIENRLMDTSMNYQLLDHKGDTLEDGTTTFTENDTLLLKADDHKNNIGYRFLQETQVQAKREESTGTYKTINTSEASGESFTETYQKLIINHGKTIIDGTYAYVYQPGATETSLTEDNKRFELIENTKDLHAVRDTKTKTLAATIWSDKGGEVAGIKVNTKAALLVEDSALYTDIYISDPTQSVNKTTLTIEESYRESILPENTSSAISGTFIIDSSKKDGSTTHIRLVKPFNKDELVNVKEELQNIIMDDLTPYSKTTINTLVKETEIMINNPLASEVEISELLQRIVDQTNTLDALFDLSLARSLVRNAKGLDESIYTEVSFAQVKAKQEVLETLLKNYNVFEKVSLTIEEVDEASADLSKAIMDLVMKKDSLKYAQYDSIKQKITKLDESQYKRINYKLIMIKLSASDKAIQNPKLDQALLDKITQELEAMYNKMEVAR